MNLKVLILTLMTVKHIGNYAFGRKPLRILKETRVGNPWREELITFTIAFSQMNEDVPT